MRIARIRSVMHMQQARLACMDTMKSEQSRGRHAAAEAAAGKRCRTTTRTQKTNTRTTNQDGTASGRRVSSPWLQQNTASEGKGEDDEEE